MATEKGTALVVRGSDWSETSRIATLFTREFGKVRALAKGGRRLRSNFESALDLLTVCDVVFIHKDHGGLDLLTEARVGERFPHLRKNLKALNAGYYVAELLSDGTHDFDPHPFLYDAALQTLRDFATVDTKTSSMNIAGLVSRFELVWLQEVGYSPRLDSCAGCALDMSGPQASVGFGEAVGGIVCPDCQRDLRISRRLSGAALGALRTLADDGRKVDPLVHREIRGLLTDMVCHILGRRPRLSSYVNEPPSGENGGGTRRGNTGEEATHSADLPSPAEWRGLPRDGQGTQ